MADVFISYARSDQPVVRRLADAVKSLGYSVWWDDELPPHLSYSDVITDKIGQARAAIVVWSEDAVASQWVRAEADVARNQQKLIQTSIDGHMPPMPFNQIQFAPIGDWQGEEDHPGWMKVKASLEALCGTPGGTAAPPAAARAAPAPPAPLPAARNSPLVPVLLALLVLAVAIVGVLLWSRGGPGPAPPSNQVAAQPAPPLVPARQAEARPAQTDGTFTDAATIDDPAGFTDVRGGPSADALVVARVNRGETFTTYRQEGDWWQVRTANGTIGYLPGTRIRLMSTGAAARAAPPHAAKPAAANRPPVLTMPMNPRRYCHGPGRGTAECEQLRRSFVRQPRGRGGYR